MRRPQQAQTFASAVAKASSQFPRLFQGFPGWRDLPRTAAALSSLPATFHAISNRPLLAPLATGGGSCLHKISGQWITGSVQVFLRTSSYSQGGVTWVYPVAPNKYSDLFGWHKRPIGMTHKAGVTGKECPPTQCFSAARKQERGARSR